MSCRGGVQGGGRRMTHPPSPRTWLWKTPSPTSLISGADDKIILTRVDYSKSISVDLRVVDQTKITEIHTTLLTDTPACPHPWGGGGLNTTLPHILQPSMIFKGFTPDMSLEIRLQKMTRTCILTHLRTVWMLSLDICWLEKGVLPKTLLGQSNQLVAPAVDRSLEDCVALFGSRHTEV